MCDEQFNLHHHHGNDVRKSNSPIRVELNLLYFIQKKRFGFQYCGHRHRMVLQWAIFGDSFGYLQRSHFTQFANINQLAVIINPF